MTIAQLLRNHVTFEARHSHQARGSTITAVFDDGPLQGIRIEAQVVEGRPPSTVDVPADEGHVPLLPRGVGTERSVRDLHVPLPRVVLPSGVLLQVAADQRHKLELEAQALDQARQITERSTLERARARASSPGGLSWASPFLSR